MRSRSTGRGVLRSLASIALGLAGAASNTGCYSDSCADAYLCEIPPPEPSPCDGDPATAGALDLCGVFVSEEGDDNSPGTKDAPVRTLQHAIGLAASGRRRGEAPTRRVYACGGLFEEAITLPSGVDLWGSRRCDSGGDWSYDGSFGGPNELTVIAPPAGIPVRVLGGKSGAVLAGDDAMSMIFGVRAKAADASASDGKSSIAMILSAGARAIVRASDILAGDGKDGEPGEDASSFRARSGVVGNNGADACTADVAPGAAPVVTVCGDGIESTGGYGGDGGLETGGDGTSGLPEPVGTPENRGLPGRGASSMPCTPGLNGAAGADAEHAAGAVGAGLLDVDGWVGVRGEDGKKGGVGQGGGGGGGGKGRDSTMNACPAGRPQGGAAGGSGGSGGCGGKGGQGGDYGGASIAIVALQGSELTVGAGSTVLGAKGGDGGVGGTGQWGGLGGGGGRGGRSLLTDTARGCDGRAGGNGGRGGDAGGGLGGHSLGIGSVGASVTIAQDATVSPGQAGKGGRGGNTIQESGAGQGEEGIALFWYRFDAPAVEPPR
ncbi:hypothetical protein WMF31_07125 [Sorangium sp. So ce1036]|uniref:hypothetical protein n=1 Tax=Sorangium sp. So ce1036 TaxID=3133328 RepID=UPI003EFCF306